MIAAISPISVAENSTATLVTVSAVDSDTGDDIESYGIVDDADGSQFEINTSTGVLAFKAAPNYEDPKDVEVTDPANAASNNEYIVIVTATGGEDDRALTATATVTVTVTDVDTEAPGKPAAPTIAQATFNSLKVSWGAPTNTGPAISAYDVRHILTSATDADKADDTKWTVATDAWTSNNGGDFEYIIGSLVQNTSYDVQVRAESDEGTSEWSATKVGITTANVAPVIAAISPISVAENSTGALVTVSATDNDTDDNIESYGIVDAADGSQFEIGASTGVLSFKAAPNYEDPKDVEVSDPANDANNNEYIIIVEATGGTGERALTSRDTLTVTVTDVNTEAPDAPAAPTVSSSTLNGLTVAWTVPTNTGPEISSYDVRHILSSATDADKADDANWTVEADAWKSGDGVLTYTIGSLVQNTGYDVQIRAENDEGTGEWSASVTENTKPNVAPVFSEGTSTSRSFAENTEAGENIGQPVIATDTDGGTLAYSLQGDDAASFDIVTTSGQLQTKSNVAYNYEVKNSYSVIVSVVDGQGGSESATIAVTISLTDVNEVPIFSSASTFEVEENNTQVGTVVAEDVDSDDSLTGYTVTGGDDQDQFEVVSTTGVLSFKTAPNFEVPADAGTNNEYVVEVTVKGGTGAREKMSQQTITVTVTNNTNEVPVFSSASTFEVEENNTQVGTLSANDDDDSLTGYTVTGGDDQDQFEVVSTTGVLSFKTAPNFEVPADADTDNEYVVEITATSGTGTREKMSQQTITVTVTDMNEVPVFSSASTFEVEENNTQVGTVVAEDVDSDDSLTGYTVTGGDDQDQFEVVSTTGVLSFKTAPNFEVPADADTDNEYIVEVTVKGGTGAREKMSKQTITVTVTNNTNEAPVFSSASTFEVEENNTQVGTLSANDDDDDSLTGYTVTGGDDQDQFEVVSTTGVLSFKTAPNFEVPADAGTNNEYVVEVTVKSGTGAREKMSKQTITVTVTDMNEVPVFSSASTFEVEENNTQVGTVVAEDVDSDDSLTGYTVTGGDDQDQFEVVSTTGVLSFKTAPNFEVPADADTDNEYIVEVTVKGGTGAREKMSQQIITVTVTDNTNEAPVFSTTSFNVPENTIDVGVVVANDDDDSLTGYMITGGADQGQFEIVSTTGVLSFKTAPNFEVPADADADNEYVVEITATSGTGTREKTSEQIITVVVIDVTTVLEQTDAPIVTQATPNSLTLAWDASSRVAIDYSFGNPTDVALDITNNKIYWTENTRKKIQRADFDGTNVEDLVTGNDAGAPVAIKLDLTGGKMYWIPDATSSIRRANLDGSDIEYVITTGGYPVRFVLDLANSKMYWTDTLGYKIHRANLDGTDMEDHIQGLISPQGIALDRIRNTIYWVQDGTNANAIYRADLNGSNIQAVITSGLDEPFGLALDTAREKIYWTDTGTNKIQRANYDGTNVETFIERGLGTPLGLVVDIARNKIYWTDIGTKKIEYADLDIEYELQYRVKDTGNFTPWSQTTTALTTILTDLPQGQTYEVQVRAKSEEVIGPWSDSGEGMTEVNIAPAFTSSTTFNVFENTRDVGIVVAEDTDSDDDITGYDITGGADQNQFDIISATGGLRFKVAPNFEAAADVGADNEYIVEVTVTSGENERVLTQAQTITVVVNDVTDILGKLDAPRVTRETPSSLTLTWDAAQDELNYRPGNPTDVALDVTNSKIYWTDTGTNKIQRADFDGTNVEDLVTTGLDDPVSIALDILRDKIYWADSGTNKIQRANLDGTNVEDLVTTGLDDPVSIALDILRDKIYWGDSGTNKIQCANLDGTNVEDLVTGSHAGAPVSLALDLAEGKVYWIDNPNSISIRRANLDGSNAEIFSDMGLVNPASIVLDTARDKIYWADSGTNKIQRANFDGTNVEDLVTGSHAGTPASLALDIPRNKIFWTDSSTNTIQCANLDIEYELQYRVKDTGNFTPWSQTTTALTTILTDLPQGQTYEVQVRAKSEEVIGPWSDSGEGMTEVNIAPAFTSSTTFNVFENTRDVGIVVAEDTDSDDDITGYDITGGADQNQFDIISATGGLRFKVAPNFEAAADVGADNEYIVEVTVTSGENERVLTQAQTITVVVNDVTDILGKLDAPRVTQTTSNSLTLIWEVARADVGPTLGRPTDVALDVTNSKIYWTDFSNKKIQRADFDGTNVEDLVTGNDAGSPTSLALDLAGGKVYWIDHPRSIRRADLDGSNVETLITLISFPTNLALDTVRDKIYWVNSGTNTIHRANFDGTNVEDLIETLIAPEDVALDLARNKIYWTENGSSTDRIQCSDLDGSNIQALITDEINNPTGLALDTARNKIYWMEDGTHANSIKRADLDGNDIQVLVTRNLETPFNLAVDIARNKIYWADMDVNKIQRADLDVNYEVQYKISSTGTFNPWPHGSLAVTTTITGLTSNEAYEVQVRAKSEEGIGAWSDSGEGVTLMQITPSFISSATFSVPENVTHVGNVSANDANSYAITGGADQNQFEIVSDTGELSFKTAPNYEVPADADTNNEYIVEVTATNGVGANALTATQTITINILDISGPDVKLPKPTMKQSSSQSMTVVWELGRARLDYQFTNLTDIALDIAGGKIYWTDNGTDKIQRADLDGTNVEDLITTGLGNPASIALDIAGGKIYWTDAGTDKVQRADLDGTNVEDLVTDTSLSLPAPIALDVARDKVYWADNSNAIWIADVDGANSTVFLRSGSSPQLALEVDSAGGKVYFIGRRYISTEIYVTDLDVSRFQFLRGTIGSNEPVDLSLDLAGNKIYWTVTNGIGHFNLRGDAEYLLANLQSAKDIAFDSIRNKLYWTNTATDSIEHTDVNVNYEVQYRAGRMGNFMPWSQGNTDLTATISGLSESTNYEIRVRATNQEGSSDWSEVGMGRTNSPPVFTLTAPVMRTVKERVSDINLGDLISATDPDGDTLTYSLSGSDAGNFSIDAATGQIQSKTDVTYDYATESVYSVMVEVSDGRGGTANIAVEIIAEPNDPPVFNVVDTPAIRVLDEDASGGSNVGPPVTASDPNDDSLRYRLIGLDAWNFTIDAATGQIQSKTDVTYDYATESVYSDIKVQVFDDRGGESIIPLRIAILPSDISTTYRDFVESKQNGTTAILPDYSYTGYHYFKKPVPNVYNLPHPIYDITDYGAIPNDNISDQPAIKAAIAAAEANGSGIIYFPAGRYLVNTNSDKDTDGRNQSIYIQGSNIVLKGEGSRGGGTIIRMINDMKPASRGALSASYMFIFEPANKYSTPLLANITENAARGVFWIKVDDSSRLSVGDWVRLKQSTTDTDVINDFLDPSWVGTTYSSLTELKFNEPHSIAEIRGDSIRFNEPLLAHINSNASPEVRRYSRLEEIGVEDISFQGSFFSRFEHHKNAFHDSGFGMLNLNFCVNSWIRRVSFTNCTNRLPGINNSAAISAYQITIDGNTGHTASVAPWSARSWIGFLEDLAPQFHGLGLSHEANGIVYYRCDMADNQFIDIHKTKPSYSNLFDRINGGKIESNGGAGPDPTHLWDLTFWNFKVVKRNPAILDFRTSWQRYMLPIIVGLHGTQMNFESESVEVLESNGTMVEPESLFDAQLELRLGSLPRWFTDLRTEWETLRDQPLSSTSNAWPVMNYEVEPRILIKSEGDRDVDLTNIFSDPDGDFLSIGARASSYFSVTVNMTDKILTLMPRALGSATIILRATDDGSGVTIEQTFDVKVVNKRRGSIYWTVPDRDKIRRADLDGTNVTDLITGLTDPTAIELDVDEDKIYWADAGTNKIQHADLDGTNVTDLITGLTDSAQDIVLDKAEDKIYWTQGEKIVQADSDGMNNEDFITDRSDIPRGIALDSENRLVYWIETDGSRIQRTSMGLSVDNTRLVYNVPSITVSNATNAMEFDGEGKVYWISNNTIRRANIDGTDRESLVTGLSAVPDNRKCLALDIAGGKMYWMGANNKMRRADLDGTNQEDFIDLGMNADRAADIVVDMSK